MDEEKVVLMAVSDEDAAEQAAEEERQRQELIENLGMSIDAKFQARQRKRIHKENQWLRSARLYYGKLSQPDYYNNRETPWTKESYSNRPDVNVVRAKCNTAIAQTVSMQFGASTKNWDLFPSKVYPDPSAARACSLMADEIEEQMSQSQYVLQCTRALRDRVLLGTGVLKGPQSIGTLRRSYRQVEGSDVWEPVVTVDYAPKVCHVNPWMFYPDDTVEDVKDIADSIEVHPLSALEVKKLMKHPGFMKDAILKVLESPPPEYKSDTWADFAKISENNSELFRNKYVVLEYHGPISKHHLECLDMFPSYDSVNDEYYGEVWVCNGHVIRVELEDIEASFRIPYYICEWEKDPASVFGFGVPLMMEDAQRVVNEAWHMILDNSSLSAGPQVAFQKGLIEPANGKWELKPGQMWYLTDAQATVDQAIQFFNVPNVTENIVPIMQMAMQFSEEESMIPLLASGLMSPEPVDTATGGMMMKQASTTLLDFMSEAWDSNITAPLVEAWYAWNMQYNPRPEIKGTFTVDVRTSTEYKNKQLHVRDLEKLSVESANNPGIAKWVDVGELARVRLEMMNLPSKTIIKTPEQVAAEEEEAKKNQMPPVEYLEIQLKQEQLEVEKQKLQFEMQQQQQREAWDHEEKITANQARLVEAQARVVVSQNEKETELVKLAQKADSDASKIMSQEKIARENLQTQAFLKGLEETRKQQENELWNKEIDLKNRTGSGV